MKLTDLFEGALLSHTEEDDAHFDHVMARLLDSPAGAPRRDHLVFVKDIANLSVFATRWPVAWRTQFFFMAERKPVGFAILQQGGRSREGDKYGITMIYLQPPFRKQGFGVAFYRFLQSEGINLEPDSKQSAGGAAIWRKLSSATPEVP